MLLSLWLVHADVPLSRSYPTKSGLCQNNAIIYTLLLDCCRNKVHHPQKESVADPFLKHSCSCIPTFQPFSLYPLPLSLGISFCISLRSLKHVLCECSLLSAPCALDTKCSPLKIFCTIPGDFLGPRQDESRVRAIFLTPPASNSAASCLAFSSASKSSLHFHVPGKITVLSSVGNLAT